MLRRKDLRLLLGVLALLAAGSMLNCQGTESPRVRLTWQSPMPQSGVSIVGYNVYRRTPESESFIKIAEKVPQSPYDDRLVSKGRTYFYTMTSVDQAGRESRSSEVVEVKVP